MSLCVPSGVLSCRYCSLCPQAHLERVKCPCGHECCCQMCHSSRAGRDTPALLVPRGLLSPSRSKLLSDSSWPCFNLGWGLASQPNVCGARSWCREFIRLGDSSMGDAAPLGVPALCHCWSPPLPILPPLDLTPVISSSMAVFKGLSHIFPSSSHALVSVAVCGSAFQH